MSAELKWIAVMVAVIFSGMYFMSAYEDYSNTQCRIQGMAMGYAPEQIVEICRRQPGVYITSGDKNG